jgi:hypothetical protein
MNVEIAESQMKLTLTDVDGADPSTKHSIILEHQGFENSGSPFDVVASDPEIVIS